MSDQVGNQHAGFLTSRLICFHDLVLFLLLFYLISIFNFCSSSAGFHHFHTYFMTEPRREKTGFLHMRKQRRRSAAQLISAFAFTIWIVKPLYYLHLKFQAKIHLLWLYRPVCVGPGRKPRRPVFSQRG